MANIHDMAKSMVYSYDSSHRPNLQNGTSTVSMHFLSISTYINKLTLKYSKLLCIM